MPHLPSDWHGLSDCQQLEITHAALQSAFALAARQAELLAVELANGTLSDPGGAEALNLFARVLRSAGRSAVAEVPDLAALLIAGQA